LDPNDSSWRELIRLQRSDLAESIWKDALAYIINNMRVANKPQTQWKRSIVSLATFMSVYLWEASKHNLDASEKRRLSEQVATLYENAWVCIASI
jgi:hypothetical protein